VESSGKGGVMFTVYILFSPSLDRYYIGQTADLPQRLSYHKAGATAVTARTSDWQLVFAEDVLTRADAMQLEKAIKRGKSHSSIRRYIADPRNRITSTVPQATW
jgi:putative endonuclease